MAKNNKSSPLRIGLTLDYEQGGGYSKYPWYAIRENYCGAVSELGALAIPLPHDTDRVADWLDLLDGIIPTGGDFDIDPSYYGEEISSDRVTVKQRRTEFELALVKGALARDIPILGICGGMQLLAVALGGKLIQHIPDSVANALAHEQPNPRDEAGHSVTIKPQTMLHRIIGKEEIEVNSAHHQAVREAGNGTVISALATDGVIEAIEHPDYRFCLGVQWHPEFHISPADNRIFQAFIAACGN